MCIHDRGGVRVRPGPSLILSCLRSSAVVDGLQGLGCSSGDEVERGCEGEDGGTCQGGGGEARSVGECTEGEAAQRTPGLCGQAVRGDDGGAGGWSENGSVQHGLVYGVGGAVDDHRG